LWLGHRAPFETVSADAGAYGVVDPAARRLIDSVPTTTGVIIATYRPA
jgi:hypothetical protein